jgi:hypothetical protein
VAELDRAFAFAAAGLLSAPASASSLRTGTASSLSLYFSSLSSTTQSSSSSSLGCIQSRPSYMDTRIWAKKYLD